MFVSAIDRLRWGSRGAAELRLPRGGRSGTKGSSDVTRTSARVLAGRRLTAARKERRLRSRSNIQPNIMAATMVLREMENG